MIFVVTFCIVIYINRSFSVHYYEIHWPLKFLQFDEFQYYWITGRSNDEVDDRLYSDQWKYGPFLYSKLHVYDNEDSLHPQVSAECAVCDIHNNSALPLGPSKEMMSWWKTCGRKGSGLDRE